MSRKGLSPRVRFAVLERDGFECTYCGHGPPNVELHVDHVYPVALGGSNEMSNLVAACRTCNAGKAARKITDPRRFNQSIYDAYIDDATFFADPAIGCVEQIVL